LYESLNGGTTAFLEHAHNNWSIDVVKRGYDAGVQSGARLWWCVAADDRQGITGEEMLDGLAKHRRGNDGGGLVELGLAWDGMGSQSAEEVDRKKHLVKYALSTPPTSLDDLTHVPTDPTISPP